VASQRQLISGARKLGDIALAHRRRIEAGKESAKSCIAA